MDDFEFCLAVQENHFPIEDWDEASAKLGFQREDYPALMALNAAMYPLWNEIMKKRYKVPG